MNNESFYAKIEDADIYGINSFLGVPDDNDIEIDSHDIKVSYLMEPDAKSYGLRGVSITVSCILITLYWEVNSEEFTPEERELFIGKGFTEYRNDTFSGSIELEIRSGDEKWEIINEAEFTPSGAFSFENIEIDFKKFKLTLT